MPPLFRRGEEEEEVEERELFGEREEREKFLFIDFLVEYPFVVYMPFSDAVAVFVFINGLVFLSLFIEFSNFERSRF